MHDALIDQVRRQLRADLATRLQQSGVAISIGDQVAGDVHALMDQLLVDFQLADLDRHDVAVVGGFLFATAWPRIVQHVLPLSARSHGASARTVERLSLAPAMVAADA